MTLDYATTELANARAHIAAARAIFEAAKPFTRKWREAEEELYFWQCKAANMEAAVKNLTNA